MRPWSGRARLGPLALSLVITWLIRRGRPLRELDAALLLEREQGHAAYIPTKRPLPVQPPRTNAALQLIAKLDGILARKCDGDAGVVSI